ncbi:DUF6770 family protein [Hymenobacter convexus]|uniref:DUF6770 family protein n=1 Tax=Hymenobacter sp. CA1UV-4 TaxID=3063782 RepID=UPI002712BA73|nr:DUF6770 family protein [Hymenobacter sp. CA1UV-4]MDO7852034.1 hypothetical protein [Hymenobacter sp. CA1UV-4]
MRRFYMFLAAAVAGPLLSWGQTVALNGVSQMSRSAISPIYADKEVRGYLLYAKTDRADRKNDNYRLDFYDQDLGKVSSVTIQKPAERYEYLRNAFNGNTFVFYFRNLKTNDLELEAYDTNLQKTGEVIIPDVNLIEASLISGDAHKSIEATNAYGLLSLLPVPGKGFVRNGLDRAKLDRYGLEMYDSQLKLKWRAASDPKINTYEALTLTDASDKYLVGTLTRRPGYRSREITGYMIAFDIETGRKVLDQPISNGKTEQLSLNTFSYDPAKHEFIAVGEYYRPDDKALVDKSLGFFVRHFGEDGKVRNTKYIAWDKDVQPALPPAPRATAADGYVNFIHGVNKGANGNTYVVAEQYKVAAGLGGKASFLVGNSLVAGQVGDMLLFVLDPQDGLRGVKSSPKDHSVVRLNGGVGYSGTGTVGQYMKTFHGFDYQFTQRNSAGTAFNSVYINYDKEKGEDTKKVFGTVGFGDGTPFAVDRVEANALATAAYVYPAKPGYVMLVDYLSKQNQVNLKLVKLNI